MEIFAKGRSVCPRLSMLTPCRASMARGVHAPSRRFVATLSNNPHIYVHPQPDTTTSILSLLPTSPPRADLAIGTTTSVPPTPNSLKENANFLRVMQSVIKEHCTSDPTVQGQAQVFASSAGSNLGAGGALSPRGGAGGGAAQRRRRDTDGGASSQGGMGGGGKGGWVHVSDVRNPPDYGRISWPEDIFGSVEVDGAGQFVDGGRYQESGTYRVVTNEGILGLSDYLRKKVVEKLKKLEAQ